MRPVRARRDPRTGESGTDATDRTQALATHRPRRDAGGHPRAVSNEGENRRRGEGAPNLKKGEFFL